MPNNVALNPIIGASADASMITRQKRLQVLASGCNIAVSAKKPNTLVCATFRSWATFNMRL
jgi:hypothetical protein